MSARFCKIVVLVVLFAALAGCGQRRVAELREVPAGYRGWAVVVWGEPGFPSLPAQKGKPLIKFPADGIVIKSTPQQFGSASDRT